jgi:hypothetical protein
MNPTLLLAALLATLGLAACDRTVVAVPDVDVAVPGPDLPGPLVTPVPQATPETPEHRQYRSTGSTGDTGMTGKTGQLVTARP